jgi:hypothetical protein
MGYTPNEPFAPKQQRKQYVSAMYCDENLEQRMNKTGETSALLAGACGEYTVKE